MASNGFYCLHHIYSFYSFHVLSQTSIEINATIIIAIESFRRLMFSKEKSRHFYEYMKILCEYKYDIYVMLCLCVVSVMSVAIHLYN